MSNIATTVVVAMWSSHGGGMGRGIYATMAGLAGVPCPRVAALLLIGMCFKVWRVGRTRFVRCPYGSKLWVVWVVYARGRLR